MITAIISFFCLIVLIRNISAFSTTSDASYAAIPTRSIVSKVAVTGATGRTGRFVVQELKDRGVDVVAIVRDLEKAEEVFGSISEGIDIKKLELTSEEDISKFAPLKECDAVIWCATGFSERQKPEAFSATSEKNEDEKEMISIDAIGVPAMAKYFTLGVADVGPKFPRMIMLSSAGVTRPSWDDEKKKKFRGASEIPIVRLNPFGILGIKASSEESLRESGAPYCIVRPTGLNDDWPIGSRPILSQGDVAVGRINRKDVATLLVDILSAPEAIGKTFETFTVAGYPPALSLKPALERLKNDIEGLPDDTVLEATYTAMQQLLPGEKQDSSNIALGQTYEQMDRNEEGRFGTRGEERVGEVKLKPSSVGA